METLPGSQDSQVDDEEDNQYHPYRDPGDPNDPDDEDQGPPGRGPQEAEDDHQEEDLQEAVPRGEEEEDHSVRLLIQTTQTPVIPE